MLATDPVSVACGPVSPTKLPGHLKAITEALIHPQTLKPKAYRALRSALAFDEDAVHGALLTLLEALHCDHVACTCALRRASDEVRRAVAKAQTYEQEDTGVLARTFVSWCRNHRRDEKRRNLREQLAAPAADDDRAGEADVEEVPVKAGELWGLCARVTAPRDAESDRPAYHRAIVKLFAASGCTPAQTDSFVAIKVRDGRDVGRRRTVVTESEFLARRESVDRVMVVCEREDRTQIGVLEDTVLVEHYVARASEASLIGNVYLGKVQNVLPSMEAAFVDIGRGRNAVLYSGEVDWDAVENKDQSRRIELALKPGDKVLVQVTKDPVGHKGARLTSQVSLPGRYLVYVPNNTMNGISRKLPEPERLRLKKILKEVLPENVGVIVRTAAEGARRSWWPPPCPA
jgi:hypothetical protein